MERLVGKGWLECDAFLIKLYNPKITISGEVVGLHQYILTEQQGKQHTSQFRVKHHKSPLLHMCRAPQIISSNPSS